MENKRNRDIVGFLGPFFPFVFMIVIVLAINLFTYIPIFFMRLATHKDPSVELLEQMPIDSKIIVEEIASVNLKTQTLLTKLGNQIADSDKLLNRKKNELEELKRKISLLQLTTDQLEIISKYNKTISKNNPSLKEFFSYSTTWYNILINFIIAMISYWIGKIFERRKGQKAIKLSS